MKLRELSPGDTLVYGAYGPMDVASVEVFEGGWNGKWELARITFTTGLGFTAGADTEAQLYEKGGDK